MRRTERVCMYVCVCEGEREGQREGDIVKVDRDDRGVHIECRDRTVVYSIK